MEAMETKSSKAGVKLCVRFGEWLVNKGLLTHRKLSEALGEQRRSGGRLGEVLLRLKIVTHKDITHALAEYLTIDYVCLDDLSSVDMSIARSVPEAIAKRFFLVAIGESEGKVVVAMCDPLNVVAIDTVALKLKRRIKAVISSVPEVRRAIGVVYHGSDVDPHVFLSKTRVGTLSRNCSENSSIYWPSPTES